MPSSLSQLLLAFIISFSFRVVVIAMVLVSPIHSQPPDWTDLFFSLDWRFLVILSPYQRYAEQYFQIQFRRLFENIDSISVTFPVPLCRRFSFLMRTYQAFSVQFFCRFHLYFFFPLSHLLSASQANINKMIAAKACVWVWFDDTIPHAVLVQHKMKF